jgi:hypothetical protein
MMTTEAFHLMVHADKAHVVGFGTELSSSGSLLIKEWRRFHERQKSQGIEVSTASCIKLPSFFPDDFEKNGDL